LGEFDMATSEESGDRGEPDGNGYYEIARHTLEGALMEQGSLEMVRGLALMANYL
jgi:transcriptional regulatory protein GAL4